ncbi:MAG TPA: DOMON-like domain-containing protein [Pseudolabrys sp.]|nr:DOMON-like domain-containing protein [Pseudolabrys sp.]
MRQQLRLHPDSRSVAVAQIEVEIARPRADILVLSYIVTGNMGGIRMPLATAGGRSDELWRHTCFEAFVRVSQDTSYYELNFSPSKQWAAYRFSNYRKGMRAADEISGLPIEILSGPDRYTLQISMDLDQFLRLPSDGLWRLGLSALIEDMSGRVSYWALAHPPGKPDFHHADCFAYEFSPTVTS